MARRFMAYKRKSSDKDAWSACWPGRHLTNLLCPTIETLLESTDNPSLADVGAGKSYLGFILYDLVLGPAGRGSNIGVEERADLVDKSRALAIESGFERMKFTCRPLRRPRLLVGEWIWSPLIWLTVSQRQTSRGAVRLLVRSNTRFHESVTSHQKTNIPIITNALRTISSIFLPETSN
jgi:hypothetical protein